MQYISRNDTHPLQQMMKSDAMAQTILDDLHIIINTGSSQTDEQQAIKMEKEQLEEAWNDGNLLGRNGHVILEYTTGKEYYKETYKQ